MNNTLQNGLELLSVVASSTRQHGVTELSKAMDLPKSHVHRLLQSLVASDLLDRSEKGRYSLSLGILRLSRELLLNLPIRLQAMPELIRLGKLTDLHLVLAVPYDYQAISVAHIHGSGQLADTSASLGTVLGFTNSASGKLFLAYQSESHQQGIVRELFFEASDRESYLSELQAIRNSGYSLRAPIGHSDFKSFALPIFNVSGIPIAALGGFLSDKTLTEEAFNQQLPLFQKAVKVIQENLTKGNNDELSRNS